MPSAATQLRVLVIALVSAGILYVMDGVTSHGPMDRRDISLAILIFMFLALLGAVSVWVAWRRPISILWKLPVLFLSIGAGIGVVVWALFRIRDPTFAVGALIMQTVGTGLALLMMIAGQNP